MLNVPRHRNEDFRAYCFQHFNAVNFNIKHASIAAGYLSDTLLHLNDIFEDYILRFTTGYMFLLVSSKLNQFSNYVPLHAILAICCINPCIPTLESN